MRRGTIAAAVVAALVVCGMLPGLLSQTVKKATNSRVIRGKVTVVLGPQKTRCQHGEFVPASARRLAFLFRPVAPLQGPLEARLTYNGRLIATAAGGQGFPRDRLVSVPLHWVTVQRDSYPVTLCLHNLSATRMGFEGNLTSSNPEAPPSQNTPLERRTDEVRIDYEAEPSAKITQAGAVAQRWSLFRPSFVRPWLLWVVLVAFVAVGAVAVRRVIRDVEP
jgi:hypothetical protein